VNPISTIGLHQGVRNQNTFKTFMRPLALYWSLMLWVMPPLAAVEPVILNVQAEQITGTRWVDISYEIRDPDSAAVSVYVKISADSGQTCLDTVVISIAASATAAGSVK
jgi:hypothetical protein